MGCGCEKDKPKHGGKSFTKAVVEIVNPEKITLLRKVVIPASLGDETTIPPAVGDYHNVILTYEASKRVYLYSSDGIPTFISTDLDAIEAELERLGVALEEEINDRETAVNQINSTIDNHTTQISNLSTNLANETTSRQDADTNLQNQIDAISASSDVKDIVGTHQELERYDTTTLGDNDIIKVLQDETQDGATTYYRWDTETYAFSLIGEEGPYYTKAQADTLLSGKQDTLTAGENISIVNNVISSTAGTYSAGTGLELNGTEFSIDDTVALKTEIPTVNNGAFTIQKNGSDVASFTANSGTNVTANITVPTDTAQLSNGAGFQTASDVTALVSGKQDALTAGNNIQINGTTISATDTTYSAGNGLNLTGTVFSADTDVLQTKLTPGNNITINNGVISSSGGEYTAGNGLELTNNVFAIDDSVVALKSDIPVISSASLTIQRNGVDVATFTTDSATPVTANITVPTNNAQLANGAGYQTASDVQSLIIGKQDVLTAGNNIQITGNTISATDTKYSAGEGLNLTGTVFSADTETLATKDYVNSSIPTDISELNNDAGYITNTVNNLTNYTPTTDLAAVATSGDYNDLINTPTIPTNVSSFTNDAGYLTNTNYATDTTGGVVKVGAGLQITNGVLSTTGGGVADAVEWANVLNKPTNVSYWNNDAGYLTSVSWNDVLNKPTFATVATSGSYNDLSDKPTIPTVPTNVSAFTNDANYQNSSQVQSAIATAVGDITSFDYQVVQTLPATGVKGTIYLVPNSGTSPNIYDEYIYVNNTFEKIGTTEIDLSDYVTNSELTTELSNYTPTASLATVATSGSYNDLSNKPTIPAAQVNSNWNATSGVAQILNKPTKLSQFTNDSGFITSYTETDPIFSASPAAGITSSDIISWDNKSDFSGDYNDLTNKPTIPAAQVNSDWNATSGVARILNKPAIPTATSDLANDSGFITNAVNNLVNYTPTTGLAEVATSGSYNDLEDKPTLATVATSGSYNDLSNKPTIPAAQINSDWNASSGVAQILNKPTLATVATSGSYNDLTNKPTIPTVPTNVSAFTNDAGYQNSTQVQSAINSAISGITGFEYQVVQTLPATGEKGVIYLVSNSGSAPNVYDEYIWIESGQSGSFEKIGTTETDLSGYVTDGELQTALADYTTTEDLAAVATSGSYNDLSNKPTIPAAQVNSDWNANSGVAQILNKPTLATVATSGSYDDLSDKPTIPTVNNATLTIQKNGTTVKTFTANASSNVTANITVPTATSDLTNDSGFITGVAWGDVTGKPTFATVATTGSYDDLEDKPTIPAAQVNADWNATSGVARILNKPTIPTVPTAGTTATAVSTTASGGSATTWSKSDHVHSISSSTITGALGYTPYNSTNPNGYTSNTGTITGVSANGTSVATSGVANIPSATTSRYGVTQLSSATNSTSTSLAATPSAVKAAYDLADSKQNQLTAGTGIDITNNVISATAVANTFASYQNGTLYITNSARNADTENF